MSHQKLVGVDVNVNFDVEADRGVDEDVNRDTAWAKF